MDPLATQQPDVLLVSRIKVPTDLITEQEEGEMRARLSVDADAIEEVSIRVAQI